MDRSYSHSLQDLLSIDSNLADQVLDLCTYQEYPQQSYLNQAGIVNNKGMFLMEGACKYMYKGMSGNEMIFHFLQAPAFLPYSLVGFFLNEERGTICVTLTPIKGLEISSDNLLPFIDKYPQIFQFYFSTVLKMHEIMQSKETSTILDNSTKRYEDFTETYSSILDDIPLKDIASYLHIQPGSLSRIRKKLNK